MSALLPLMARLYRLALRLYPAAFRGEYAEEMQAIFRLRLEDAAGQGRGAVIAFTCKEAIALPSGVVAAHADARKSSSFMGFWLKITNLLIDRGSKMPVRQYFPKSAEKTPWLVAILSMVPFLLPGPFATLFSYHPGWNPADVPLIDAVRVPLMIGLLALGFIIGVIRRFPRWSYLYSLYMLFLIPFGFLKLVNRFVIPISPHVEGYILIILLVLAVIACRFLPLMRPFFANIRQDWTLLSYAFYACALFAFASTDQDASPVFNLQVMLPGLIVWLGALAHLRLGDPLKKVGALFGSVLLGGLIWLLPVFSDNPGSLVGYLAMLGLLLFYWTVLGGIILVPLLFSAYSRPRSQPSE